MFEALAPRPSNGNGALVKMKTPEELMAEVDAEFEGRDG